MSFAVTGCSSPADVADPGAPPTSHAVALQFRAPPTGTGGFGYPGILRSVTGPSAYDPIVVAVVDERGQVVTRAAPAITLTIGETNGASLGGTTTVTAVEGLATFSDLSVFKSGTYTLTASSMGLLSTTSTSFRVSGGPCAKLAFYVEPTGAKAGTTMASFGVACLDEYGNPASAHSPSGLWDVTIAIGANPGNATLSGTLTSFTVGSFTDIVVDKPGVGYTLVATGKRNTWGTLLTPDTSAAFTITP